MQQLAVLGDEFDVATAGRMIPAGFIGSPADIGKLAVFLASDESRYVTGLPFLVDAGSMLKF